MGLLNVAAYKPVPGTLEDANQVANGLQAIQDVVNAIDNNNFAAGKIFDPTKLMQNGAAGQQPLAWRSGSSDWGPGTFLDFPALAAAAVLRANQVAADVVIRNKLLAADAINAYQVLGDGKTSWGPGGAGAQDTNLYRDAAGNRLKTDDNFVAADGVTTKTKAGVPVDGDFQVAPGDGTIVADTTNGLEWIRFGGAWVPKGVLDRATTTVDLNTSVTETSLYSKAVPANLLGTNRLVRLTAFGDFLHNNVAGDTVTIRVKFGGTTFFANATPLATVIAATRQAWVLQLYVMNLGATNSQAIFGVLSVQDANAPAPTTGIGTIVAGKAGVFGISTLGTIDTTANQTLDVTAQWSASSANNSWRQRGAILEVV